MIPNGMPTPSPTFWLLVSPALLADGEVGSSEVFPSRAERVVSTCDDTLALVLVDESDAEELIHDDCADAVVRIELV